MTTATINHLDAILMQSAAFDPAAPADERTESLSALHRNYAPRTESGLLLPMGDLAAIAAEVKADLQQYEMLKAQSNIVPFPSPNAKARKPGMQSVYLDDLQLSVVGDYWERPSSLSYESMRQMVEQTPILNAIVMTRVRQMQRFCHVQEKGDLPGFIIAHQDRQHQATKTELESIAALQKFFLNCGWEFNPRRRRELRRTNLSQFIAMSARDSLVLDSAPIETEFKRDKSLGIDGFYPVDGATMRLCTEKGYRGDDEIIALQVVQGRICTAYTRDDLLLEPRNPRTDVWTAGYGLSEIELLVRIVTGFLNALTLNMRGFSDNSIPRGIMHLIGNYSQDDMVAFKRYWNSMVKGINNAWSVPVLTSKDADGKAEFVPVGIEFNEMYFARWMTFLTSICCAVYGMSPDEINFESFAVSSSSLSGSDTAEKLASSKDKGLRPLMSYYESMFTDYIVSTFDDKYCFRWAGLDDADAEKRHEVRKLVLTVDEMRAEEGYEKHDDPTLGAAPVNQGLMGVYMQELQSQQQDFGGQDGGGAQGNEDGDEEQDQQAEQPAGKPDDAETDGQEQDGEGPKEPAEPPGKEAEPMQKSAPLDFGVRDVAVYRVGDD